MRFLALPVRNLRSHGTRSALTAVGIAIAVAGMLVMLGLARGIERYWAMALAMVFLAVLNAQLVSVRERTGELALLCAMGWHPARVMGLVALEGLWLAAMGAALGTALGLACLRWMMGHSQMGAFRQLEATPGLVIEAAGLALLLGFAGGLYPAWRATRLNPGSLSRSE